MADMKIKIHKSKISKKGYSKFSFPSYTRKQIDESEQDGSMPSVTKLALEKVTSGHTETAAVGFFAIKNLDRIILRMKNEQEKFGKCLNHLVSVFTDIITSEDGVIDRFTGNGASYAYTITRSPIEAIKNSIIAALRMRYILNKLNRNWEFYHDDSWKIGFGLDFGDVNLMDHPKNEYPYTSISGKPALTSRGIGKSAVSGQIYLPESIILQFPFIETLFDTKPPKHVPVMGMDYSCKTREIIGMIGPQAKKIYETYV
ncbi:hypothetical protein ACFL7D_00125 [candidate division KSB1 bacterium]